VYLFCCLCFAFCTFLCVCTLQYGRTALPTTVRVNYKSINQIEIKYSVALYSARSQTAGFFFFLCLCGIEKYRGFANEEKITFSLGASTFFPPVYWMGFYSSFYYCFTATSTKGVALQCSLYSDLRPRDRSRCMVKLKSALTFDFC